MPMTRIRFDAEVSAEELLTVLQSVDPNEEPDDSIDIFGGTATASFQSGVEAVANFQLDIFTQTALVTRAQVFDPDGVRVIDVPAPGIEIDTQGDPTNLDEIEGFDFNFLDTPDRVDAAAFLSLTENLQNIFLDVPIEENLQNPNVDFGTEPDGIGLDPALRDTLVLEHARADVTETVNGDGTVSITSPDGDASLTEIDRIELTDGTYVYDLSEDAGFVYRLYSASLARTPDEGGLRFWDRDFSAGLFGEGVRGELALAAEFVDSPEFVENFLADDSDEAFIDALYLNVLGRVADDAGKAYWLARFQAPDADRNDLLWSFAGSDENVERIQDDTDDGFWVLPEADIG